MRASDQFSSRLRISHTSRPTIHKHHHNKQKRLSRLSSVLSTHLRLYSRFPFSRRLLCDSCIGSNAKAATAPINLRPSKRLPPSTLPSRIDSSQRPADTVVGHPLSVSTPCRCPKHDPEHNKAFACPRIPFSRQRLCWTLSVADLALTVRAHISTSVLDEISNRSQTDAGSLSLLPSCRDRPRASILTTHTIKTLEHRSNTVSHYLAGRHPKAPLRINNPTFRVPTLTFIFNTVTPDQSWIR